MIHNPKIYNNGDNGDNEPYVVAEEWVRPIDWISIPEIASGEQVIYGLMAIFEEDINYCAVRVAGNYTVDWGDGTIENIVSLAQAEHIYYYTTVGNDCSRGYRQALIIITPQLGQNITYVDFRRRHTSLPAVVFNTKFLDIVVNAPNIVGNNLYFTGSTSPSKLMMLERVSIRETGAITSVSEMFYSCYKLQQVDSFNTTGAINFASMFASCYTIQKLPLLNTSSATNLINFATYCYNLVDVPNYDTSNVLNFSACFYQCYNLERLPNLDLRNGTNFSSFLHNCFKFREANLDIPDAILLSNMFYSCIKIKSIILNTSSALSSLYYIAMSCYKLESFSISDTSNVTNMSNAFQDCVNLKEAPILDTSNVTIASAMFVSCYNITNFPNYNLNSLVTANSMFAACYNLEKLPDINSVTLTNSNNIASNCPKLIDISNIILRGIVVSALEHSFNIEKIAPVDCALTTTLQQTFNNLYSIKEIELTNCDSISGTNCMYYTFNNCLQLKKLTAQGLKVTFSVANCSLDTTALNDLFTSLGTPSTTQIVTVKGNSGASTCDTTIATAKNWSVVII